MYSAKFVAVCALAAVVAVAVADEIPLRAEIPTYGSVQRGKLVQYELIVAEKNANVSIEVSPLYGDPDLFVSCSGPASPSSFTWKATHFGHDFIDIYETDKTSCVSHGGRFHIAVYGWVNSTYVLNAAIHTSSEEAEYLMDGIQVEDHVAQREVKFFQFYVRDEDDNVEFVLTPSEGDPDLLVGCYPHLTVENAQWKSWSTTVDRITVNATSPGRCRNAFYIGVLGYTESTFSLFARTSTGRATFLTDRESVRDAVYSHEYQYFEFNAEHDDTAVNITVVPRVGDPDLYVDCTTPSKDGHWRWRSIHMAGHADSVIVQSTASGACHSGPEPRPYQVAVYGFTYSVFDIEARNQEGSLIASRRLSVGEPRFEHMRM